MFTYDNAVDIGFLGKGLRAPLTTDPATGDFARVTGEDNLWQCILGLLEQRIGERLHHEDDGLPSMLFEDVDVALDVMPIHITELLQRREPRIRDVQVVGRAEGRIPVFEVSYTVRATNARQNRVYPYYLEPPTGGTNV